MPAPADPLHQAAVRVRVLATELEQEVQAANAGQHLSDWPHTPVDDLCDGTIGCGIYRQWRHTRDTYNRAVDDLVAAARTMSEVQP